jgi:hypothetical protein
MNMWRKLTTWYNSFHWCIGWYYTHTYIHKVNVVVNKSDTETTQLVLQNNVQVIFQANMEFNKKYRTPLLG